MSAIEKRISNLASNDFQKLLKLVNETTDAFHTERKNISIFQDYSEIQKTLVKLEALCLDALGLKYVDLKSFMLVDSVTGKKIWNYIKKIIQTDQDYYCGSENPNNNFLEYKLQLGEIYMNMLGY